MIIIVCRCSSYVREIIILPRVHYLILGVCDTAVLVAVVQCVVRFQPNRWDQPDHLQPDLHLPPHHGGGCG